MKVKRNEMDTASDTGLLKSLKEHIAVDSQPIQLQLDHVQMPRMLHIRRGLRANNFRHVAKSFIIERSVPFPSLPETIALFQLGQSKCCSNVGQIVFEAW